MIKLAIIGAGWAGTRQAHALHELHAAGCDQITLHSVIDPDLENVRANAQAFGTARLFARLEDALQDETLDAVSICTPHNLHCAQTLACAAAGKHVLVEKPMARSVAEATEMITAAARHGVRLYVAESMTYSPMSRFLAAFMAQPQHGGLGDLVCATVINGFRAPEFGYAGRRAWLTQPEQGGTGTWMLHGIHSIAQLRHVLGEVTRIYLRERRLNTSASSGLEGTLSGTLDMHDGLLVNLIQTRETQPPDAHAGFVIHGEHGALHASPHQCELHLAGQAAQTLAYPSGLSEYARELQAFADVIEHNTIGPTDGLSERRSLAVIEAGSMSLRTGQAIELAYHFGNL